MQGSVLGLDLTSLGHDTAAVVLAADLTPLLVDFVTDNTSILALAQRYRPHLVAIDAPLTLPHGLCCLESSCSCGSGSYHKRSAELWLAAHGVGCFFTTKNSIIKDMVDRGVSLARDLRAKGYSVIEVYPYASKVRLWGDRACKGRGWGIPRKNTPEGQEWLRQRLGELLPSLQPHLPTLNHDLADAAIAAYTAWLHRCGRTQVVGGEDGPIVLPAATPIDTHHQGQIQ